MHTPSYRLIWFQHFHKAGGTSIVELARRNGERFWTRHGNGNPLDATGGVIPLWRYPPTRLSAFVDQCQALGVTFVATEWGLPLLDPLRRDPRVTLITALRRPLDRLLSNFYFDVHYGYTAARSLNAYVASNDGVYTMPNYYTRILSRHDDDSRPVDQQLFERALWALRGFDHWALLEHGLDPLIDALGWRQLLTAPCNTGTLNAGRLAKILRHRQWRHLGRLLRWPRRRPPAGFVAQFEAQSRWDLRLYGNCSDPCKQNSTLADKSELTWQDMAPSPSSRVSESDASAFPPCSSANTILPSSTRRPWRR